MDTNSKSNNENIESYSVEKELQNTEEFDGMNEVEVGKKNVYENQKQEDTKTSDSVQKKQKNIPMKAFITLFMILLLSVISVSSYIPIKDKVMNNNDNIKEYVESYDFAHKLARFTQYLVKSEIQGNDVNDYYDYWRFKDVEIIKYYISDGQITKSNISDDSINSIDKLIENSKVHMRLKIDENGKYELESSSEIKVDENKFTGILFYDNNQEEYSNLEIVYIINEDIQKYNDVFSHEAKRFYVEPYAGIILVIGVISGLFLIIIAFSLKFSFQKQTSICNLFNAMFLEFKILLWILLVSAYSYGVFEWGISEFIDIIYEAGFNFYLIGIPVVFVLFTLIYLSIVYIKYIYFTGFKEGFIKNSLLGRICFYIIGRLKELFESLMNIDITKNENKKLIILLGIHLITIFTIVVVDVGPLSLLLAIGYTIFIFKYLLKLIDHVRSLNNASSQLSEGKFDVSLNEDIGILSPIAKNLKNIKYGFKVAIDKATKSQKMKTELISNVSHDLKTPLTSIITYVDLLKTEDIDKQTQIDYIHILDKKAKRLNVLIEDLFEASKAGSGNIDLQLEQVDVIALFRQTVGELEEKIKNSTLIIKTTVPENKVMCYLDGRRTYRVFENIMSNIFKYSMKGSRVYIDVEESQNEVRFIFKNMSAYEMNFDVSEITERFTRGDKARNTEGSGLGLSIAKSLVELQNGKLTIIIDGDLFKLIISFPKVENLENKLS